MVGDYCLWGESDHPAFGPPASSSITPAGAVHKSRGVVVVRLPRLMEGNGVTPIFRSLQNCQFHHRRLESFEHFNVLYIYIYNSEHYGLSFLDLRMPIFFYKVSLFCIHFYFCMCVMYLTSI